MTSIPVERRARQRIMALREGLPCFRMAIDGREFPLVDLSLEGFAMPATGASPLPTPFAFRLHRDGAEDEITGRAQTVNFLRGAAAAHDQSGCRFLEFDGDGQQRLKSWLAAHVAACASIPVSPEEAEDIVTGPSLV